MNLSPTFHFTQRLNERFEHKGGRIRIEEYERVTPISSNRYDHPKINKWINERKKRNCNYLVSKKNNIVVPVGLDGRMITALWYNGRPKI